MNCDFVPDANVNIETDSYEYEPEERRKMW